MNVGASRPEDAGLYFSWGNIVGVSADDEAAVAAMTEAAYANTPGASINRDLTFDTEDAAMAIMGVNWCMPTDEDWEELIANCDWLWVTVNGIQGYQITSRAPGNTNSIFLPAGGRINDGSIGNEGNIGYYWEPTYDNGSAMSFEIQQAAVPGSTTDNARYCGLNIRARRA